MPPPKDPIKFKEYKENQRRIALERGFGTWMRGRKDTPFLIQAGKYGSSIKGTRIKVRRVSICIHCKKKFYFYPYEKIRKYCSRECYLKSPIRKQEYAQRNKDYWKDRPKKQDTRPIHNGNSKYKEWRTSVFERDNWTCRSCKSKGYVEAHHIKSWHKFPNLRYEVNNGLTLCKECHKKANRIHKKTRTN